jgi:hypothetical protein
METQDPHLQLLEMQNPQPCLELFIPAIPLNCFHWPFLLQWVIFYIFHGFESRHLPKYKVADISKGVARPKKYTKNLFHGNTLKNKNILCRQNEKAAVKCYPTYVRHLPTGKEEFPTIIFYQDYISSNMWQLIQIFACFLIYKCASYSERCTNVASIFATKNHRHFSKSWRCEVANTL